VRADINRSEGSESNRPHAQGRRPATSTGVTGLFRAA